MKLFFILFASLVFTFSSQAACLYNFEQAPGNCHFSDGDFPPIRVGCKMPVDGSIKIMDFMICSRPEYMAQLGPDMYCPALGQSIEYYNVCDSEGPVPSANDKIQNQCSPTSNGSIVYNDSQVLSEVISLTGTGFNLVYSSEKVKGRKEWNRFSIPTAVEMSRPLSILQDNLDIKIGNRTINFQ